MNSKQRKLVFLILVFCLTLFGCTLLSTPTPAPIQPPVPTQTEMPTFTPTPVYWNEIPIMPGASTIMDEPGDYQFSIPVPIQEIRSYYQLELPRLGWGDRPDMVSDSQTEFTYLKGNTFAFFKVVVGNPDNEVSIHIVLQ